MLMTYLFSQCTVAFLGYIFTINIIVKLYYLQLLHGTWETVVQYSFHISLKHKTERSTFLCQFLLETFRISFDAFMFKPNYLAVQSMIFHSFAAAGSVAIHHVTSFMWD